MLDRVTRCPHTNLRTYAWEVVTKCMHVLSEPAYYHLFHALLETCPYSHVRGLLVRALKDAVDIFWKPLENTQDDMVHKVCSCRHTRDAAPGTHIHRVGISSWSCLVLLPTQDIRAFGRRHADAPYPDRVRGGYGGVLTRLPGIMGLCRDLVVRPEPCLFLDVA